MSDKDLTDAIKDLSKTINEIQVDVGVIATNVTTLTASVEKHCDKCTQTHLFVDKRINDLEIARAKSNGMMNGVEQTKTRTIGIAQLFLIGLSSLLSSGVTVLLFYLGKILN